MNWRSFFIVIGIFMAAPVIWLGFFAYIFWHFKKHKGGFWGSHYVLDNRKVAFSITLLVLTVAVIAGLI